MPSPSPVDHPNPEETLFAAALQWETPAQRAAYLDEACAGNTGLRGRVEALLHAVQDAGTFLDSQANRPGTPASAPPARTMRHGFSDDPAEAPGTRIGRYKLLQQIGEGGCGTVFMAEQEEPVRRRVALKVIKLGMDTKSVVARFEAERQALAMMDHPNIAKVLDAGATDSGRPFFVMELVRGIPITRYCDENKLDTRQRLDLFIKVCQAIQHAHQKGIIHRDIKPSNILVTLHDGVPVPKVIDFGIAKATEGRLTNATLFTAFEQFIGTPAYMSPEQAEMSGLDIDTRSDIYALGVLLYELLTGKTPFDATELAKSGLDAMRKTIREREPQRPSTRLSTMQSDALTTTATAHGTDGLKLLRLIRGDLDWIVMKCLEKDRTRRYETANGLTSDLKRHLENEPVVARPPSQLYRFQKAFRRNRLAFTAAGCVLASLIIALVFIWTAGQREARARVRESIQRNLAEERRHEAEASEAAAQSRLAESETLSKFLTEVFQSPDPARDGRTITMAEALGAAAKKLDGNLADQPGRRAQLQATLGLTYLGLGLFREAAQLQGKVRDYYATALGPEHTNTIIAMANLANCYAEIGRFTEALKLREEVLTLNRKVRGPENRGTVYSLGNLASSYVQFGRVEDALRLDQESLRLLRKVLGPEDAYTVTQMSSLADSYCNAGRLEEANRLEDEALALGRRINGPEHPSTLIAMRNIAVFRGRAGHLDEAIRAGKESLVLEQKVHGPEHPQTLLTMTELAVSYLYAGQANEALKLLETAQPLSRKVNGPDHPDALLATIYLAIACRGVGREADAERWAQSGVETFHRLEGIRPPDILRALTDLAVSLRAAGRLGAAITLQDEVLQNERRLFPSGHPETVKSMDNLATCYEQTDRKPEAEVLRHELAQLNIRAENLIRFIPPPTGPVLKP